jgi:hypothetical protein
MTSVIFSEISGVVIAPIANGGGAGFLAPPKTPVFTKSTAA